MSANGKPRRWYSPRRSIFWMFAPVMILAIALAVLMFSPGLAYSWEAFDGQVVLIREQSVSSGISGDEFYLQLWGLGLTKYCDDASSPEPLFSAHYHPSMPPGVEVTIGDHQFCFYWWKSRRP
jgi:hypothetical protein